MKSSSNSPRMESSKQLHDLLCDKGEYLYRDENEWYLAAEGNHRHVRIITLKPSDSVWRVPADHQATYVFVFDLKQADLTENMGQRVASYLLACRNRDIKFRVARPLPPEILPRDAVLDDVRIPKGCEGCLELFRFDQNTDTQLCDSSRLNGFAFTKGGRSQIYNYLKLSFGDESVTLGNGERSALHLLRSLACTKRPNHDNATRHAFDFAAYWVSKVGWGESLHLRQCIHNFGDRLVGGPILDDGGGHGKDSFFLKKRGFEPILLDLNADLLNHARRKRDETDQVFPIFRGDGTILPFADATFSGVYSGGVMHHRMTHDDIQQYLIEASRVLWPGGLFFGNVWARWDIKASEALFLLEGQEVFESMLKNAGLHPINPIETHNTVFEKHKHMWCFVCEKAAD